MLYCPRCRATYKEGTVRFCTKDNTRLVPATSKQKTEEPEGIFTNILGANLLFGEEELLQPKLDRTVSKPKKPNNKRKPLFAPSFEPPKGSRFFKSEAETDLDNVELEKESKESNTLKEETSFKDVSLSGVITNPEDALEETFEEVEVEKDEVIEAEQEAEPAEDDNILEETEADDDVATIVEEEQRQEERPQELESSEDLVEQQIKNRYKITEKIGQDEIGTIYLAKDKIALDKKVVVNIFADDKSVEGDEQTEGIFGDAREVLTRIKHPNVENVLDSGNLPSGEFFTVSEFLEGKPLSILIEEGEQFDLNRTAQIVRQISYGLNEFHQNGFIYRNLKPENIVLCVSDAGTEQVKILNPIVSGGGVGGERLEHRSPEQIEGNVITIASDTYSLASITFLILTGKMPFEGADAEELFENQNKKFKSPSSELRPELPVETDEVLKKALAFSSADRYLQAKHFGDELYNVLVKSENEEEYTESATENSEDQVSEPIVFADAESEVPEDFEIEATRDDIEDVSFAEEIEAVEVELTEPAEAISNAVETEDVATVLDFNDLDLVDEESKYSEENTVLDDSEEFQSVEQSDEKPFEAAAETSQSKDEILETTPLSVASFKSSDEQIIDLDNDDEDILSEISRSDDEIIVGGDSEISSDEDQIIELDTGESTLPPVAFQTSDNIELDLDDLEMPPETEGNIFELDFDEIGEEDSSGMPIDETVSDFTSDINLDIDGGEDVAQISAEMLPEIELNLDNLDKVPETSDNQEALPVFEFDLEEIEEETPLKIAEEPVSEKAVRKPEIRIISPEKPFYKRKEIEEVEEVTEAFEDEEIKPVVIKPDEVESTEDLEIGKKVEGDVEEEKDYSWVLLPLLLLLLLIAFIVAFWYFGGQGQDGLVQNTNTPAENNQIISPNQSVNSDQAIINGEIDDANAENGEDSVDSNSETDFFGDNFGAPGGGSSGGTSRRSYGSVSNPQPPPPPRNIEKAPNKVRYKNTKQNTPRKLRQDFLGFTIDYPKDWKKNSTRNNFLDISKNDRDGTPIKQLLITEYDSTGTYEGDRELFDDLVKKSNEDLKRYLPNFELISESETIIQDGRWRAYEVRFKGDGRTKRTNKKLTIWGKRFWIPIQRPGMDSGFVITMLVSSLASEVNGIDDVGVEDDLAEILKSFEPTVEN